MAKQRSYIFTRTSLKIVCPTCPDINIGNVTITPKTEVRDLGVIFDKHLAFTSQINNVCKSAFYALTNIRKIRNYLDSHSTERLIHAFISSRIDNCNSLFCGLPVAEIEKLQRVQNAAARLLTGSKQQNILRPHYEIYAGYPLNKE